MSRPAFIAVLLSGLSRLHWAAAIIVMVLWLVSPVPASAQTLDDRDYEICSFYDREDRIIDYDRDCLDRRRALHRHRLSRNRNIYRGNVLCPWHANNGQGYNATFYLDGRNPSLFGTWDSAFDGRPCVPRGRPFTRGYP